MGVIYSVLPVTPETRSWLEELCGDVPGQDSRYPLIGEIYDTLNHLPGCRYHAGSAQPGQPWQAEIESTEEPSVEWAHMAILKFSHPAEPQEIYFSKGSPELIFRILAALANSCGALALIADGEDAFMVPPQSDPAELFDAWLKTQV